MANDGAPPIDPAKTAADIAAMSRNIEILTRHMTEARSASSGFFLDTDEKLKQLIPSFEVFDKFMQGHHKRWLELGEKVRNELTLVRGSLGSVDKFLGGAAGMAGQVKGALSSLFPGGGGLLGFMLHGLQKDAEFAALGQKAKYIFEQVGGVANEQAAKFTAQTRTLYRMFGEEGKGMLAAVHQAFAQGSQGVQVLEKSALGATKLGDSIAAASLAMDSLTGSAAGTDAKLVTDTINAMGVGAREAQLQVARMTGAIREAHLNYAVFAAGIVQANSSLRMQNQSLDQTVGLFQRLRQTYLGMGVDPTKAGTMALERLQGAAGALQGMPMGLQGMLAGGVAARGMQGYAGLTDPYAMMVRFRLGQEGKGDQGFMGAAFAGLREQAGRMVGGLDGSDQQRLRAIGGLSAVGGMSEQAAAAIIDSKMTQEEMLDLFKSDGQKNLDALGNLKNAFDKQLATQNRVEKLMRDIGDEMAQLAMNLFKMVAVGFKMMGVIGESLPVRFKLAMPNFFRDDADVEKDQKDLLAMNRELDVMAQDQAEFQAAASSNLTYVWDRMKSGSRELTSFGSGMAMVDARRRREAAEEAEAAKPKRGGMEVAVEEAAARSFGGGSASAPFVRQLMQVWRSAASGEVTGLPGLSQKSAMWTRPEDLVHRLAYDVLGRAGKLPAGWEKGKAPVVQIDDDGSISVEVRINKQPVRIETHT